MAVGPYQLVKYQWERNKPVLSYERRAGAWAKCSGLTVDSYVAVRFRLYIKYV